MDAKEKLRFPRSGDLLGVSLFSQTTFMEGFSDEKALKVFNICKKHIKHSNHDSEIKPLITNILMESLARNVGNGENYGSGYPHDFLEKIEHELEIGFNEVLIYEIMEWGYGILDHVLIKITKNKQQEYFFQNEKEPRELISFQTMLKLVYRAIENRFNLEYGQFQRRILQIPLNEWAEILDKDETIHKYF